ncbi:hypothetical protein [Bacteroides acidifaciens]|uniref:hypothetical protein n=1 Tax=Bacteroides acidifaciens TaxID=85831 RepID=UPI0025AE83E6|nr:hypothetical protein [Bacteroides acidifaciens]
MIEWSNVANDISKYAKSVFKEDSMTITESELKDALNILYHVIYEPSGVFELESFSRSLEDALNKAMVTEVGVINPLRSISILFDSFLKRIHVFENHPINDQKGAFIKVINHFGLTQFSDLKNYNTQGESWKGDGTGKYILYKAVIPRNDNTHLAPDWDKSDVAQHLKYALAAYLFFIHIRKSQILAAHPDFLQDPSINNRKAVTDDDLAAYDFLKFSRASGELKRDIIRCFVLRLMANEGPINESAIKTRVDEFVGKTTLDAHTYCLNGLCSKGKIEVVSETPKTYSLTDEERQRLTDYANDCSHNKMQFKRDVQNILNGTTLAGKTDEVLIEFKNLVTQRLKSAAIVVDNVGLNYDENEDENSFLNFLNANINDIETSKNIYKEIIAVCGSNDIVYRLCAGSFMSSLASTTEYSGNFPKYKRDVFLDTQVILHILCVAYDDFEPGQLYDYKIARDLVSIARNDKNGLSLKFANTYITEVKGHLNQALQLIEIADAEDRKFKLHTNNVFYNHYADLKESVTLPDGIITFKDYLYELFNLEDKDAEDDYRSFLDYSLADQIRCLLNEACIELFYLPLYEYEDTKKSEKAFNAVLKNNEKAHATLEHDVRMGQYLFDWEDKPQLFFISRDHSFDLYRKKYAELFCRSTPYFWQLFTPVNFVNSIDLLEMKFDSQVLSEDLLLLVDREGGKDNAKYFADVNTKLTNLPGITAAERRKRQRLNFELFTNKNYNDIEEDTLGHADMIAAKLNRTWDSLFNHMKEKCPDNIEKAFAPLLDDAIYMSVVENLRSYVESIENDLNALLNKIDVIIYENDEIIKKADTDFDVTEQPK